MDNSDVGVGDCNGDRGVSRYNYNDGGNRCGSDYSDWQ